jgi:hypothetical protein
MKVKELKEAIEDLPDDMLVVLQRDSEGNGYSPLSGADPGGIYVAENTYSGEMYSDDWTADDCCLEDDEWDALKKGDRTLVLHPVN